MEINKNILGIRLESCSLSPLSGYNRDGTCQSSKHDLGVHGVCSQVTDEFLNFTKNRGNDLSTPSLSHDFPGLKAGDRWCLCASRWKEAFDHGVAPPVVLSATSEAVLEHISLDEILSHAVEVEH